MSRTAFQKIVSELVDAKDKAAMSDKERNNLHNIIGALLSYTNQKTENELITSGLIIRKQKQKDDTGLLFGSQAELIEAIITDFPTISGLTKRNLETAFSKGKRALGISSKE
jgi:hypothetical protein